MCLCVCVCVQCGFFKRNRPEEFPSGDENVTAVEDSPLMNVNAKENGGVSENDSTEKENKVTEKENVEMNP